MGKNSKGIGLKDIDFRELIEISCGSICVMDSEGRIVFLKGDLEERLGEEVQDIIGRKFTDFLHSEDVPRAIDMMGRVLSGEAVPTTKLRVEGLEDIYSLEVSAIPVRKGGKIVGMATIVRNITGVEKHRKELEELRRRFLDMAEVLGEAGEGMIIFNRYENVPHLLFANSRALEMLGYEADVDVNGISIGTIFDEDVLEVLRERPNLEACEVELLRKTGERIPVEIVSSEISFGEKLFQLIFLRDITERKRIEDALRESEEKYRTMTENSLTGMYIFQDGVFKYINRRFEEIMGYSREEIIGRPFWELVYPDDGNLVRERGLRRERGEDVPPRYEIRAVKKDGSVITVEVMATRIEYQGRPAVFGNLVDITQRKLLEEQLRQAQKMESLGTLTGGIAHDFNNILVGILGYASLLKTSMDKSDPRYRYVDVIERSASRASELTKQLLSFARSRKHEIVRVDLNKLVSEVVNLLSKTLNTPISIKTELEENLWHIGADEGQIHQVIMNLCVNASEAMPNGGILTIKTENLKVDREFAGGRLGMEVEPGDYVRVTISDTGVGMDEDTVRRIFDPFFTTKGGGTGLGLSVVYGIVKDHGGYIDVRSKPGKGTTFELYFPTSIRDMEKKRPRGEKPTVLLVDDEEVVREVGKDILEKSGYRVILASNGIEAVRIYSKRRGRIDLVILDMVMPEMDGKSTFNELKRMDPGVKVLLSSSYSVEEQVRETLRNGALGFIRKPYSISELTGEIDKALSL